MAGRDRHPIIMALTDDLVQIGGYLERGDYFNAFNKMDKSLDRLKDKDKKEYKEFIDKIKLGLLTISRIHRVNPILSASARTQKARELWAPDFYSTYMSILWNGKYLIEDSYKTFFDPALGRKSGEREN